MMSSKFAEWIHHAYRRRYIVGAIILVCLGWSIYTGMTAAPTWKSETLLSASKGFQSGPAGLSSLAQRLGGAATLLGVTNVTNDVDRLAALISSRSFTENLLKSGLLQEMRPKQWEAQKGAWIGPPPSLETAVQQFDTLRSVNIDRQSGLIRVGMIAGSPEQARAWLWKLINKLNEVERARALTTADVNLVYLQNVLNTETNKDLRDGLLTIVQGQLSTRMLAKASKNFAVDVVDPPYLPESRNSPNRKVIVFEGGIIGIALAFLFLALERAYPALRSFFRSMSGERFDKTGNL